MVRIDARGLREVDLDVFLVMWGLCEQVGCLHNNRFLLLIFIRCCTSAYCYMFLFFDFYKFY